jgi:hypothetical protein
MGGSIRTQFHVLEIGCSRPAAWGHVVGQRLAHAVGERCRFDVGLRRIQPHLSASTHTMTNILFFDHKHEMAQRVVCKSAPAV